VITTESDEVKVSGVVITNEPARHDETEYIGCRSSCYPMSENPDMGHPLSSINSRPGPGPTATDR
jgi:hypothetical protein